MARKSIPTILKSDPNYVRQFVVAIPPARQPEQIAQPVPVAEAVAPPAKPASNPRPKRAAAQTKQEPAPSQVVPKAPPQTSASSKTIVALTLGALKRHVPDLTDLAGAGVSSHDVLRLAGRALTDKYRFEPRYVPPVEAERAGKSFGYFRSTRELPTAELDRLAVKHDPLGLNGSFSLIKGQIEPLFWQCLDDTIEDLKKRFLKNS
jgi:hypothetical protein